jgi:hypothetical protein
MVEYTDEKPLPETSTEPVRAVSVDPLLLDESAYAADLSEFDLTDEQRNELLTVLWSIMSSMVELGFTHDVCGQIFDGFKTSSSLAQADVDLKGLEAR